MEDKATLMRKLPRALPGRGVVDLPLRLEAQGLTEHTGCSDPSSLVFQPLPELRRPKPVTRDVAFVQLVQLVRGERNNFV